LIVKIFNEVSLIRNNILPPPSLLPQNWVMLNPWFMEQFVPELRERICKLLKRFKAHHRGNRKKYKYKILAITLVLQ
jgi:hypothetical protein